ncbi:MAG TPA: GntR family transcriptional regulator [Micromonosporaceae bacterium]|nr:GntR family transcriptional regulator [Micromonosporaceae bacterium]
MTSTRYLEIADRLAAELAACAPGTRVASENEISTRFGVGRAASRSALQELERRLVVRRIQGAGTFVNRRIDYVISRRRPPSWTATVTAAGATPRAHVKAVERMPMPADLAARLGVPVNTAAHRVIRHFYIDDLLVSRVHEWIPTDLVPDLGLALHAVESLDLVLRQMGRVRPVRAWCRVSLDAAPPDVLAALQIEASVPVWLVESVSRDGDSDRGLMCSSAWTRGDAVRMVVELDQFVSPDDVKEEQ